MDTIEGPEGETPRTPRAEAPSPEQARREALHLEVVRIKDTRGCSYAALAKEIGIPEGTFSQWTTGKYAGRMDGLNDKVQTWLQTTASAVRARATQPDAPPFQMTQAAQVFIAAFEHAQHGPDLVMVSGAAGVGKTSAAMAYRGQSTNVWLLTAEPCISTSRMLLDELADLLGVIESRSTHRISRAIVQRMTNSRGLLIVDEAQHLGTATLDQVRTLHDLSGVGVVVMGNEAVANRVEGGSRRPEFAQLFSRVGMRVSRPRPSKRDIEALLDAWAVADAGARRLLAAIARKPGALRIMAKVIRLGLVQSRAADEALTAKFVEMAWQQLSETKLEAVQ